MRLDFDCTQVRKCNIVFFQAELLFQCMSDASRTSTLSWDPPLIFDSSKILFELGKCHFAMHELAPRFLPQSLRAKYRDYCSSKVCYSSFLAVTFRTRINHRVPFHFLNQRTPAGDLLAEMPLPRRGWLHTTFPCRFYQAVRSVPTIRATDDARATWQR